VRKRILAAGTAFTLTMSLATFGLTGVALAGEDDPAPPPAEVPPTTVTVPVPGPTTTVEVPGPTKTVTVTTPAPTPKKKPASNESSSGSSSSSGTLGASSSGTSVATTAKTVSFSNTGVDTGTHPVGGVQAGAGGTAPDAPAPGILALGLGMLAFAVTAAGVTLRRRAAER
jgi:hypothetical protein